MPLTIILLILLGLAVTIVAAYFTAEIYFKYEQKKERQEQEYESEFNIIQSLINDWPVCEYMQLKILKRFTVLENLPFRNDEKTEVLWNEYAKRYNELSKKILSEAEYSVDETFRKN